MNTDPFEAARDAADYIAAETGVESHDVALVLGSGWAEAADLIGETTATLSASEVPGFHKPAVVGHVGTIRSVLTNEGKRALVLGARTHYYEGRGVRSVVHGVRTAAAAGCKTLVLTNGCGGLNEDWKPGTPVLISDHINLTATSPLEGASFVDLTDLYSSRLRSLAREVDSSLQEGVGSHRRTPCGHGGLRYIAGHQPRRRHQPGSAEPRRGTGSRRGRKQAHLHLVGRDHRQALAPSGVFIRACGHTVKSQGACVNAQ